MNRKHTTCTKTISRHFLCTLNSNEQNKGKFSSYTQNCIFLQFSIVVETTYMVTNISIQFSFFQMRMRMITRLKKWGSPSQPPMIPPCPPSHSEHGSWVLARVSSSLSSTNSSHIASKTSACHQSAPRLLPSPLGGWWQQHFPPETSKSRLQIGPSHWTQGLSTSRSMYSSPSLQTLVLVGCTRCTLSP